MVEKLTKKQKARSLASLKPNDGGEIEQDSKSASEPKQHEILETDTTIIGDLRSLREPGWETAQQIRIQARAEYQTALVHVPSGDRGTWNFINPEIQACVHEHLAVPVNPAATLIKSKLLMIRQPHAVFGGIGRDATQVPRVLARTTVVVADSATLELDAAALRQKDTLLRSLFGDLFWTATRRSDLARLRATAPSLEIDEDPWPNSLAVNSSWSRPMTRKYLVAGRVCGDSETDWPGNQDLGELIYPSGQHAQFRVLCLPRLGRMPFPTPPENWDLFRAGEISWQKFLRSLDFIIYYPSLDHADLPFTAIRWAMAHGVVAILPPELEPAFGTGPLYLAPDRVQTEARRLHDDPSAYDALATRTRDNIRQETQPDLLTKRLEELVGPAQATPRRPSATRPRRILFISSNGVGIGHLTRLLAVARRMPAKIEPVFATMSQAVSIVEQCGFPAEYIPSQGQTHSENPLWNIWLTKHLDHLLRFYGASHIVFDGNHAYSGLIRAAATRSDCRLVWIRRGMWRPGQAHEPFIGRQKFFDLVLEPEEIASSRDLGATIDHRGRVVTIPPIRFLDAEEILSREEAAAKIGLDPARLSVLVQLGSGANRDIVSLVNQILASAQRAPNLQVVVAEWLMSHNSFSFWPHIKRLRGFPLSLYFAAFDFTVTAAGYNSFNEVMSFGLPAIFSPNTHATMDDQAARAAFAEEQGAGFSWSKGDQESLDPLIDALLDVEVRRTLRVNALRIARPNGAADAASAIASLVQ